MQTSKNVAEAQEIVRRVEVQAGLSELLANYRAARAALLAAIPFPDGCRVRPPGVKSASWQGYVKALEGPDARSMSADMVFVVFDCGNRYPVAIDELERAT